MKVYKLHSRVSATSEGAPILKPLSVHVEQCQAAAEAFSQSRAALPDTEQIVLAAEEQAAERKFLSRRRNLPAIAVAPKTFAESHAKVLSLFAPHQNPRAAQKQELPALFNKAQQQPEKSEPPLGSQGGNFCDNSFLDPTQKQQLVNLTPLQQRRLEKELARNPHRSEVQSARRQAKAALADTLADVADSYALECGWEQRGGDYFWPCGALVVFERQKIFTDKDLEKMGQEHAVQRGLEDSSLTTEDLEDIEDLRISELDAERGRRRQVRKFLLFRDRASKVRDCNALQVLTTREDFTDEKAEDGKEARGGELVRHHSGVILADKQRCEWRFCPECSRFSSSRTRLRLAKSLAKIGIDAENNKGLLLCTFTARDFHDTPLHESRELFKRTWREVTAGLGRRRWSKLVEGGLCKDEFTFSTPATRKAKAAKMLVLADNLLGDPEVPHSGDFLRVEKLRSEATRLEQDESRHSWHYHSHALIQPTEAFPRRKGGSLDRDAGSALLREIWRDCLARVRKAMAREACVDYVFDAKDGGVNAQIPRAALLEITKYVVKPIELASYPVPQRREIIEAMEGQQLHRRWGSWRVKGEFEIFSDETSSTLSEEELEEIKTQLGAEIAADLQAAAAADEDAEGHLVNTALHASPEAHVGFIMGTEVKVFRKDLVPSTRQWHREAARQAFEKAWEQKHVKRLLALVEEKPNWPLRI